MNRLLLIMLPLFFSLALVLAQGLGIHNTGDRLPVSRQTAMAGNPATYTSRQIRVGSGGGFTGFSTTYYLLENGRLFGRRSRDTSFTFIGQQRIANTKRMFAIAENKCRIKTAKFDYPGNVYSFIQWKKGKQENKVSWGATGKIVPATYRQFYQSFMAMIPDSLRLK